MASCSHLESDGVLLTPRFALAVPATQTLRQKQRQGGKQKVAGVKQAAGAPAPAPLPPQQQLEEDAGWAVGFPAAEALAEERSMLPPDADEDLYAQVSHCS